MSIMQRLRAYHAVLASCVIAAFVTGEAGLIHALLGYAIAVIIIGRVVAAFSGVPQLGIGRFYPQFQAPWRDSRFTNPAISKTLLAAIAACLIAVTASGIGLDRGAALGRAVDPGEASDTSGHGEHGRGEHGTLNEAHEALANLLVLLVALHVGYLLAFKRPLARFMLFRPAPPPAAPPLPVTLH